MVGEYVYYIIGGYFIIAGILGIGMHLIWLTLGFKIKVYNLEALYGRTGARVFCIFLGVFIILFGYLSQTFFGNLL